MKAKSETLWGEDQCWTAIEAIEWNRAQEPPQIQFKLEYINGKK